METSAEEDAPIDAWDGVELMGCNLKVNKAKPRENRGERTEDYRGSNGNFSQRCY